MDYEYACTNGVFIIGQPGTFQEAEAVRKANYDSAKRIADKSRFDLRIVRRKASKLLNKRPGRWQPVDVD